MRILVIISHVGELTDMVWSSLASCYFDSYRITMYAGPAYLRCQMQWCHFRFSSTHIDICIMVCNQVI